MNLYLRLLYLLLWIIPRNKKRQSLLEKSNYHFKVYPLDLDINKHLTNSRYLALMDLARLKMLSDAGIFKKIMKNRWSPILSSTELTFIKDIKPWQRCTIESKIVCWDEKYFYIEQRFVCDGKTHAIANLRGLFIHKRQPIASEDLMSLANKGDSIVSPELPEHINHWKALLKAKREIG